MPQGGINEMILQQSREQIICFQKQYFNFFSAVLCLSGVIVVVVQNEHLR